jgi:hypothetical protein
VLGLLTPAHFVGRMQQSAWGLRVPLLHQVRPATPVIPMYMPLPPWGRAAAGLSCFAARSVSGSQAHSPSAQAGSSAAAAAIATQRQLTVQGGPAEWQPFGDNRFWFKAASCGVLCAGGPPGPMPPRKGGSAQSCASALQAHGQGFWLEDTTWGWGSALGFTLAPASPLGAETLPHSRQIQADSLPLLKHRHRL